MVSTWDFHVIIFLIVIIQLTLTEEKQKEMPTALPTKMPQIGNGIPC